MNTTFVIWHSTTYTWIATRLECLIVGKSFKPLATSGMESNKRLCIGKKVTPTSATASFLAGWHCASFS
jgi:hypothetical protein